MKKLSRIFSVCEGLEDTRKKFTDSERKLLDRDDLKFYIKKHTNRKIDDVRGFTGSYKTLESAFEAYEKAVQAEYEDCMRINRSYAGKREMKPEEETYTPYYSNTEEHHILACTQVYNYRGSYVRVCLESVYDINDLKNADAKYDSPESLGLKPKDILSWSDGRSDLYIAVVEDVKNNTAYIRGSYVYIRQNNSTQADIKRFQDTRKLYGGTVDDKYTNRTYTMFAPTGAAALRYDKDLFKTMKNIKINAPEAVKIFIQCLENWQKYSVNQDNNDKYAVRRTLAVLK